MTIDLPEEVLEAIFLKLTPYKDLSNCKLVSKAWNRAAQRAHGFLVEKLYSGLRGNTSLHCTFETHEACPARRVSVATCVVESLTKSPTEKKITKDRQALMLTLLDDVLYAFGGSSARPGTMEAGLTAFNDLWKLNLNNRKWERLIPTGQYPRPKCRARMLRYKQKLILYGGTVSTVTPPQYRNTQDVNELHIFCLDTNRWLLDCRSILSPPALSMYGISEHRGVLVVTGGESDCGTGRSANGDLWCFSIEEGRWFIGPFAGGPGPRPRSGHTQVKLDEDHLVITGGNSLPERGSANLGLPFTDCWMLDMSESRWKWVDLTVNKPVDVPLGCGNHRGCQVGDQIVFLHPKHALNVGEHRCHRVTIPRDIGFHDRLRRQIEMNRHLPEVNVNGQRGDFRQDRDNLMRRGGPYPVLQSRDSKLVLPPELFKTESREYIAFSLDTKEAVTSHSVTWRKSQPFVCSSSFPVRGFAVEYGVGELIVTCGLARANYSFGVEQKECSYFISCKKIMR